MISKLSEIKHRSSGQNSGLFFTGDFRQRVQGIDLVGRDFPPCTQFPFSQGASISLCE